MIRCSPAVPRTIALVDLLVGGVGSHSADEQHLRERVRP